MEYQIVITMGNFIGYQYVEADEVELGRGMVVFRRNDKEVAGYVLSKICGFNVHKGWQEQEQHANHIVEADGTVVKDEPEPYCKLEVLKV